MRAGVLVTHSGMTIDVRNPDPNNIKLADIAHQLSIENRWVGRTSRPLPVSEHSIWVGIFLKHMIGKDGAIHGYLHDAHEYVLKDIPTPVKMLWPEYRAYSAIMDIAIYKALGVEMPSESVKKAIKLADAYVGWCEWKALIGKGAITGMAEAPEELVAKTGIVWRLKEPWLGWEEMRRQYFEVVSRCISST